MPTSTCPRAALELDQSQRAGFHVVAVTGVRLLPSLEADGVVGEAGFAPVDLPDHPFGRRIAEQAARPALYSSRDRKRRANMARENKWTRRTALAAGAAGLAPLLAACGSGHQPATTGQPAATK